MAECHPNGSYLYDSCSQSTSSTNVNVGADPVLLTVCGLTPGVTIPVEIAVGPIGDNNWCPLALNGAAVELSETQVLVPLCAPGCYRLDVSQIAPGEEPCVLVTAETVSKEDAASIPSPFDQTQELTLPDDFEITIEKPDSIQYVPVGYIEAETCRPLLAEVQCLGGQIIKPYPIGYINQDGVFTMAIETTPVGASAPTCETADVLPLLIPAGTAPADYPTLLAAALAAAPVDYATFGAAAATDVIMSVNAVPTEAGGAVIFNGLPVGSVNDPDGVNPANTIGTDECDVMVSFCVQKCLTKAETAAL